MCDGRRYYLCCPLAWCPTRASLNLPAREGCWAKVCMNRAIYYAQSCLCKHRQGSKHLGARWGGAVLSPVRLPSSGHGLLSRPGRSSGQANKERAVTGSARMTCSGAAALKGAPFPLQCFLLSVAPLPYDTSVPCTRHTVLETGTWVHGASCSCVWDHRQLCSACNSAMMPCQFSSFFLRTEMLLFAYESSGCAKRISYVFFYIYIFFFYSRLTTHAL